MTRTAKPMAEAADRPAGIRPTPAAPADLRAVFRQPFAEQAAFFRGKLGNLIPTEKWTDVQKATHDTGFMVAGAQTADLLTDLVAAVERTISEGKSLQAFRKDFDASVDRAGWNYRGERNWRSKVIYQTNMSTSYAAGREAQIQEGGYSHKMYQHNHARNPRQSHLSWHGLTLPVGDAFWDSHTPINAFGCHCTVVGIRDEAAAKRLGGRWGDQPPAGWDKIDPKTGEQVGIGKGWGYSPGATVANTVRQMAAKTQQWDYTLAKAYMQSVPASQRDALARAYRALPSVADDARRFAARALAGSPDPKPYRTLGLLTGDDAARVKDLAGVDVAQFDYALDASGVRHVQDGHGDALGEAMRGQMAVTAVDYARLPEVLNAPDSVVYAGVSRMARRPLVKLAKRIEGEEYEAVFEIRTGRKMLALETLYKRKAAQP